MSGDDWEIKWVLRAIVPSVEVESNLVYICRAFVNLARNCAEFSSSPFVSWSLSKLKALRPAVWKLTMRQAAI